MILKSSQPSYLNFSILYKYFIYRLLLGKKFEILFLIFHDLPKEPIDHIRLDVTQDLWRGLSTTLKDGSLLTFVKQLSLEYDLNKKDAVELREMFTITQWLNKQGFLLAHSQPTKLSGKSYSVLYLNTKIGMVLDEYGNMHKKM